MNRRRMLSMMGMIGVAALDLFALPSSDASTERAYNLTKRLLTEAYQSEMEASARYVSYSARAMEENYANIAYAFKAFSISERIHADNYAVILEELEIAFDKGVPRIIAETTKKNLINVATREIQKVNVVYPGYIEELKGEGHKNAILNCRYAYLSHKQHAEDLELVRKYTEDFFPIVATTAEARKPDYHICSVCGSTVKKMPTSMCPICEKPIERYTRISRP